VHIRFAGRQRKRAYAATGQLARLPFNTVVLTACVLEGAARPLYRPFGRWIADLWLVRELERRVARLPAYVALGTLAVPFAVAEPLKVVAVYWIALGHFALGAGTLVLAYGASFIVVERIYHAARPQLLTIVWFTAMLGYAAGLRDGALVKVRLARSWLSERRFT
jgi:hypothetical protein